MTRRYGLIPLAVVLLFAAGCGGKSRVAGTVTLNGSPVKGGVVTFIGADNQRKAANINADGEYQLFDTSTDPYELDDLAGTAARQVVRALGRSLRQLERCRASGCRAAEDHAPG